ncbi:MAG: integral rane protein [Nocardioides sp.]|nr:integral rane protein [Nocardioides sp.]
MIGGLVAGAVGGPAGRLLTEPPLDPSSSEARSLLRRELLHPDYHDQDLVEQVVNWVTRQIDKGITAASDAPPLTTFAAMLVFLVLVGGLAWLLSRARRTARGVGEPGAVLADDSVTAAELRARADAALAAGRHEDALVDAFRALTVRQVERGRLVDAPGATAHEVAGALAASYPHQRPRVDGSALLFDQVLYGDRPATREQASGVLELDDELAALG